ncbi:hypothetical protein M3893_001950 [Vibrio metschnikovii]|nr:hypothetical protein [Vibrio metschnikovii]
MSKFLLFLIVFDLAFPPFKFLGSAIFPLCYFLILYILNSKKFKYSSHVQDFFSTTLVILSLIILYSLLRVIFSYHIQLDFFGSLAKTLIIVMAVIMHLSYYEKEKVIKDVVFIFVLNALICLIAGTFPYFLDFVRIFKPDDVMQGWIPYRNAFLSGSGFFGIATAYSIVIVMMALESKKTVSTLLFIINCLLVIIAGVIAARTTFIALLFAFPILFFYRPWLTISLTFLCFISVFFSYQLELVENIDLYISWMFEIFINFIESGEATSHSTNHLASMFFLPDNEWSFIIGDGLYNGLNGGYYMGTDSGYMRHLFYGGIPLVLLVIMFIFSMLLNAKNKLLVLIFIILALIFHIKGGFILHNRVGFPVFLIVCYYYGVKNNAFSSQSFRDSTRI